MRILLFQLIEQLAPCGRMLIPVGAENKNQKLLQIDKKQDGTILKRERMGVIFVPLTSKAKQWPASKFK